MSPGAWRPRRSALACRADADYVIGGLLAGLVATPVVHRKIVGMQMLVEGVAMGAFTTVRFVDEIGAVLAASSRGGRRPPPARALSLLVAGLGIELGRVIVVRPQPDGEVEELIRVVRCSLAHLDRVQRPADRCGPRS